MNAESTEQGAHVGPQERRLLVVGGNGTWSVVPLPEKGVLTVGRGKDAEVRIDEKAVSRRHATLEIHGDGRYSLTDLGSANGSSVGTQTIRGQTLEVKPQQMMQFGQTSVVIQVPFEAPGASTTLSAGARIAGVAMMAVEVRLQRVAPTLINVLLLGETGVGKDVMAERLHQLSPRRDGPFLRLNCAGLPVTLLESELFGHEKGAFTGAASSKQGLLEVARGGSVLLDEVGEMPLEVQAKLLLAIEQRAMRKLGATRDVSIDVRFICATHRDLQEEVRQQRFREDFYFRINGITLRIPPLRERLDEIEGLVLRFLEDAATRLQLPRAPTLDLCALEMLRAYAWPGNIRELRSILDRAIVFSDGCVVRASDLALADLPGASVSHPSVPEGLAERDSIVAALTDCGGNQSRAAKRLGISRNTLIARIQQYGLARPHARRS